MVRGKRKDIGLGGLSTKSLSDGRKEAADLRSRAKTGEDIVESRRAEKRITPTFEEAAKTVHGSLSETFNSDQHALNWFRSLENHVFPVFGSKTVDEIDTADVLRALKPIWTSTPDTSRRTLRRIKAIFDYCQAAGYRNVMVGNLAVPKPNPCDGIKAALGNNQVGEKHHGALDYRRLRKFVDTLQASGASLPVKLALEFTILSAARTSEVLKARWEEFNLDERVWTLSATRMKMKKEHEVPLSARCVEILELAKQFNDTDIVFPGRPGQPLSNMSMLMAVRRMDYDGLTVHGFRATFKTWSEERTNFDSLVIEAALAHEVKGIERHYLRTTFFEKRQKLMEMWAAFATQSGGKVVDIMTGRKNG
jgi:integrase